jgi:periplasmic copper chaperone A
MRCRRAAVVLLAAALAVAGAPGCSRECSPRVVDGWVRSGPPSMPMMAGFGRIENVCDAPVAVVSAHSAQFEAVELHETRIDDGVSRMRAVPRLEIAAGGEATMAPGGLHLMLMRPKAVLQAGERVDVELVLDDGRRVAGTFEVRAP